MKITTKKRSFLCFKIINAEKKTFKSNSILPSTVHQTLTYLIFSNVIHTQSLWQTGVSIYKIYQFNVHQSALAQTQSTIDEFK